LNASIKRNVSLSEIPQLQFEPRRVVVDIPVSQYTEYTTSIPISKLNVPDSLNLVTLPGKVDVSCLVALDDYKNLSHSSFIIGVDYNEINKNSSSIPIVVYRLPSHIKMLKFHPLDVKYIIEKK
jgi:hypothetical protein